MITNVNENSTGIIRNVAIDDDMMLLYNSSFLFLAKITERYNLFIQLHSKKKIRINDICFILLDTPFGANLTVAENSKV